MRAWIENQSGDHFVERSERVFFHDKTNLEAGDPKERLVRRRVGTESDNGAVKSDEHRKLSRTKLGRGGCQIRRQGFGGGGGGLSGELSAIVFCRGTC